jgi:probable HAF family extracellular repeat protein
VPLDEEWTDSIGRDINEAGQVAGQGTKATLTPQAQAFIWDGGDALNLGVPAEGTLSRARGINDSGDVVGEWRIGLGREARFKAFLYEEGQMKDLNALIPANSGWDLTSAQAINENGQVVGSGTKKVVTPEGVREETHAFLYENGLPIDLGEVLGNPYSGAWSINDSGDVVGGAGSTNLQSEAFVYRGGTVDRLGNLGPFPASEAVGINNSGQAIGWSFTPGQNPPQAKAFLYDYSGDAGTKIVPLQPLPCPATFTPGPATSTRPAGWSGGRETT